VLDRRFASGATWVGMIQTVIASRRRIRASARPVIFYRWNFRWNLEPRMPVFVFDNVLMAPIALPE
jgi:hypothetical protein